MTFKTEEEAIRKANGTIYGLAAAVLTNDVARRDRMAKAFRAGKDTNKVPHLQELYGLIAHNLVSYKLLGEV